jgi:hypothetical protein
MTHMAMLVAGALLVGAAGGMAAAGWIEHGTQIFVAMAASGLSWCF